MNNYPSDWKISPLINLVEVKASSVDKKSREGHDQIQLCNYMDVFNNVTINNSITFMQSTASAKEIKDFKLKKDDVLLTKDSEVPEEIGMASVLNENIDDLICGYHLYLLRVKNSILSPKYLCWTLRSNQSRQYFYQMANGSTRFGLNQGHVSKCLIPLPPLPEQKKIAEILSCLSKLINLLDIKIEKLKLLKEAIKSKYFLSQSDSDIQIKKLKDICCIRQGLQIPIANRSNTPGENKLPYLTTSWINSNFAISKAEYIESPKESVILKEDEFVVGRTGAVGKIFDGLCCVFHNNFFAVSPKENVCKNYLMHYLTWNVMQDEILKRAGTTTIPDLNHGDFYSINIPLPSIEKQINIISKIDSINKLITVNQSSKTKMRLIHKGLSNDLLSSRKRVIV